MIRYFRKKEQLLNTATPPHPVEAKNVSREREAMLPQVKSCQVYSRSAEDLVFACGADQPVGEVSSRAKFVSGNSLAVGSIDVDLDRVWDAE